MLRGTAAALSDLAMEFVDGAAPARRAAAMRAAGPLIARGNGRAYGDSAVGARTLDMRAFDRMISFEDGLLVAEAGVLLADVVANIGSVDVVFGEIDR